MGTQYDIYTEAKINDKWYCVNGVYPKFRKHDDGSIMCIENVLAETYWNGSRSGFSSTYSKMVEEGTYVDFDALSEEVKNKYKEYVNEETPWGDSYSRIITLSISRLKELAKEDGVHEHNAFVHKNDIYAYEKEGEEIYDWLTLDEYRELDEKEKELYSVYSWSGTEVRNFKEILKNVYGQLSALWNVNSIDIPTDNMRIICIQS